MNALALALLALEVRARAAIVEQIEKARTAYAGYLAAVIADGQATNGNALNSRNDLHQALTMLLGAAQRNIDDTITSAYNAAVQLGRTDVVAELASLGHDVPDTSTANLGATLTALLLDVSNAFGNAQTDIQNGVRQAFDGVTAANPTPARQLAVAAALERVGVRLRMRITASTTTAVHQGASDAKIAVFRAYATIHGYADVRKQWKVTSNDPCTMCQALNGSIVALDAEFDRTANLGGSKLRPVYLDLLAPPRHPNCRCQIELVVS